MVSNFDTGILVRTTIALNFASNALLLATTCASKHLRSACNLLIALEAFLYLLLYPYVYVEMFSFPVLFATTPDEPAADFDRENFQCALALMPHFFVNDCVAAMPLAIAVERALGVFAPLWDHNGRQWKRALGIALPVIAVSLSKTVYLALTAHKNDLLSEGCCPFAVYASPIGDPTKWVTVAMLVACWSLYAGIWARVRWNTSTSSGVQVTMPNGKILSSNGTSATFRRLTRSLVVVITLVTIGWLVPTLAYTFLIGSSLDDLLDAFCVFSTGICSALTLPALYLFSTEYHKAVNEFCAKLFFHCCQCVVGGWGIGGVHPLSHQNNNTDNNSHHNKHMVAVFKKNLNKNNNNKIKTMYGGGGGHINAFRAPITKTIC